MLINNIVLLSISCGFKPVGGCIFPKRNGIRGVLQTKKATQMRSLGYEEKKG